MPETLPAAHPPAVIEIATMEFAVNGFGYGIMQEFLKATLRVRLPDGLDWTAADEALAALIPRSPVAGVPPDTSLADRIIYWVAELQRAGNQPVFTQGRYLGRGAAAGTIVIALPTLDFLAAEKALRLVVSIMAARLDGAPVPAQALDDTRAMYDAFVGEFSSKGAGGSNTLRFLQAAQENRMPWFRLASTVFQIGQGSKARWLDSSFTDTTGVIGSNLARNKIVAASVLQQAGLPVPDHAMVNTPEAALAVAARLGYPVVVKPLDKDGGVGVAAGLKDEAAVLKAFAHAREFSSAIMVEKHVDGRDYRLVVFQGKLIWALERVPGSVTGDGVSSVRDLIDRCNEEPARRKRFGAPLAPLVINDEALSLLAERGMDLESVPAAGEWIRLRRVSNIATGGTPVGVFDKVHPDNKLLAERAANALRLDLAGIDLLIPDIEQSWMKTGAAICEVNSQPTIGNTTSAHLYGQILKAMVNRDGRIPIALIVGAPEASTVPVLVARLLAATGRRVGLATAQRIVLNGRVVNDAPQNIYHAAKALMIDGGTDAAVVSVSDMVVAKSYLPFDKCTVVTLAGTHLQRSGADNAAALRSLGRQLVPMSWGPVVINAADPDCVALKPMIAGARVALASGGAGMSAVRDHLKEAGLAVYVEGGPNDPRLVVGKEVIELRRLGDEGPPLTSPLDDIVLSVSTVWMMGAAIGDIRRGLAGLRWTAQAPSAA